MNQPHVRSARIFNNLEFRLVELERMSFLVDFIREQLREFHRRKIRQHFKSCFVRDEIRIAKSGTLPVRKFEG